MFFAEVAVDAPVGHDRTFTYSVPNGLDLRPGHLVRVPFGPRRIQGIVTALTEHSQIMETRDVLGFVFEDEVLDETGLILAQWISEYYMCSRFEAAMQDRDGRVLMLDFSLEPLYGASGEVEYLVPAASDLTERRVAEQRIEYLATHDEITGLPNRHLLQARLAEAMEQAGPDQVVIVLLIDLDRFNLINLSLGHGAGDTVLCEAARRLVEWAGDRDRVARVGGDEFAVLLDGDVDAVAAAAAVGVRSWMRTFEGRTAQRAVISTSWGSGMTCRTSASSDILRARPGR